MGYLQDSCGTNGIGIGNAATTPSAASRNIGRTVNRNTASWNRVRMA
jgi:hypothetical protein